MTTFWFFGLVYCAVTWIVFGAMHFIYHDATLAQMPPFFTHKLFNQIAVYGTGILEILLGIGLVFKKTRTWSALGSMIMLIMILPATIYITISPDATPTLSGMSKTLFRAVNIPNAIFMFMCSFYFWRSRPDSQ